MNKAYSVIIELAEEGGYIVNVPELPGCMTQGETIEETMHNAQEAIELYLECLKSEFTHLDNFKIYRRKKLLMS